MDTNIWSFEAGYCKIKTARQKKRLLKKDRDKQLLRIDRREKQLLQIKRYLPSVPLEAPYQKGWKRTFVLSEHVARSPAAMFYTTLLSKINTIDYSNDESFKIKVKRKRNRKKIYEEKPQFLQEFHSSEWTHRCKLNAEERAHFYRKECWSINGKTMYVKYVFSDPRRFALVVSPHIITHHQLVDEVLEQELAQIDQHLERNHLRPRIHKLVHRRRWFFYQNLGDDPRRKNPIKNKSLQQILLEAYNDNL
jgi:hypothetical protein